MVQRIQGISRARGQILASPCQNAPLHHVILCGIHFSHLTTHYATTLTTCKQLETTHTSVMLYWYPPTINETHVIIDTLLSTLLSSNRHSSIHGTMYSGILCHNLRTIENTMQWCGEKMADKVEGRLLFWEGEGRRARGGDCTRCALEGLALITQVGAVL